MARQRSYALFLVGWSPLLDCLFHLFSKQIATRSTKFLTTVLYGFSGGSWRGVSQILQFHPGPRFRSLCAPPNMSSLRYWEGPCCWQWWAASCPRATSTIPSRIAWRRRYSWDGRSLFSIFLFAAWSFAGGAMECPKHKTTCSGFCDQQTSEAGDSVASITPPLGFCSSATEAKTSDDSAARTPITLNWRHRVP